MEKLMGYVTDFLDLELAKRRSLGQVTTPIDDLANDLEKYLKITNNQCQQLQVDEKALEPVTDQARQYSGLKDIAAARSLWQQRDGRDRGNCFSNYNHNQKQVVVTITGPTYVTKPQSERLLMRALGREKIPVTHDELSGRITVDAL